MHSVALAANVLLIALLVAIFIDATAKRLWTSGWIGYGLSAAFVVVAADLFLYIVTPAGQRLVPASFYVIATAVVVLRTISVTVVGLAAAERLGIGPLPLIAPARDRRDRRIPAIIAAGILGGLALVAYTAALFVVAQPGPAGNGVAPEPPLADGGFLLLLAALTVTALGEELTFRLGIQNWIAGLFGWSDRRYWIAIALSSALWSAGHIGILDPDWVKLAQIFPAGLLLGWLFRRFGFEASVVAHGLLNLIMPFLTPRLLA